MKSTIKRGLALLLVAGTLGAAVQVVAQQDAIAKQMEMMKTMMMNRPAAMKTADQMIQDQKMRAVSEGKYNCCLRNSCNDCALKMGECPCRPNLQRSMAVCNECKGGWHAGDGAVAGINPDDVKTLPRMASSR